MKRWISVSILAASAAAIVPVPTHADANPPAPATRPSEQSTTTEPFIIPRDEKHLTITVNPNSRLYQLRTLPGPTQFSTLAMPPGDPSSWGVILKSPPTTQPWRTFQFDGVTVKIEPLSLDEK